MKRKLASEILRQSGVTPVLVDVGASGGVPAIWKAIAQESIYVGFDPDLREMQTMKDGAFRKSFILNEAVGGSDISDGVVSFFLTASPFCSSTLTPDHTSLSEYAFSSLFDVVSQTTAKATTLERVLDQLAIPAAHWVKIDSQGSDLRILKGIGSRLSRVLAADLEPGLIDAYRGEDLFVDVHRDMLRNGFWLSNLKVCGAVRMRRRTVSMLEEQGLNPISLQVGCRRSPGWCEIRYLRTLDGLLENGCNQDEYILLWLFAMIDEQPGFALDVAIEYERRFGADSFSGTMYREPFQAIRASTTWGWDSLVARVKAKVPPGLKRAIKQLV
jgi:FkbM family methyltransferase